MVKGRRKKKQLDFAVGHCTTLRQKWNTTFLNIWRHYDMNTQKWQYHSRHSSGNPLKASARSWQCWMHIDFFRRKMINLILAWHNTIYMTIKLLFYVFDSCFSVYFQSSDVSDMTKDAGHEQRVNHSMVFVLDSFNSTAFSQRKQRLFFNI